MYKNQLQELAQRSCFGLPAYVCTREGPDHAPSFKATVTFNGETFHGPTCCTTLRQAEHAAAEAALALLSLRGPSTSLTATILVRRDRGVQEPAAGDGAPGRAEATSVHHRPLRPRALAGVRIHGGACRPLLRGRRRQDQEAGGEERRHGRLVILKTYAGGGAQGARHRRRGAGAGARGRRQSARRPARARRLRRRQRQGGAASTEAALRGRLFFFFLCSEPDAVQTPVAAASDLPCHPAADAARSAAAGRTKDTASPAPATATGAAHHLPAHRRSGPRQEDQCGRAGADAGEGHGD